MDRGKDCNGEGECVSLLHVETNTIKAHYMPLNDTLTN